MRSQVDPRGLTLLELLVALTLAAIITAAIPFDFQGLASRWRLNAAARQVVLDLKLARMRAIADGAAHRLQFTAGTTAYEHQREEDGAFEPEGAPTVLPRGVSVAACTAAGGRFTFRPRGNATTFGTLTLVNPQLAQRRVIVDIAGRIRVQ